MNNDHHRTENKCGCSLEVSAHVTNIHMMFITNCSLANNHVFMNIIAWVLGSQVTSRTIKWGKTSSCECFLDIDRGGCLVVNFMLTTDIVIVNLLSLGRCRMF